MDTYILTEKIEELQRFLDFINERDKQLWNKYLTKLKSELRLMEGKIELI